MSEPRAGCYQAAPGVAWAVEGIGLLLVRRTPGARLALRYPEAALWALLSRPRVWHQSLGMLAAITGWSRPVARVWAEKTVSRWVQEGWLVEGDWYPRVRKRTAAGQRGEAAEEAQSKLK